MEQVELTVQKREILGKRVKRLRREGLIPAVIYGPNVESLPIQADQKELRGALAQVGLSHLITLHLDDGKEPRTALVREVQQDVLTGDILHVDFLEVQMAEKISTEIPLVLTGESPAEAKGGILLQGLTRMEIECLPADLPEDIKVDISSITELNQELTVADLEIPEEIEVLTDLHEMVARVIPAPKEEEIEEVVEEIPVAPTEVEVIGRPRPEEEIEPEGAPVEPAPEPEAETGAPGEE
ncbi:MAG: 50S ribosomal protein L25 [Chloroflexota bacterium]|nr:50S ribosomal protein L25 [Chloroflexota bacterium]